MKKLTFICSLALVIALSFSSASWAFFIDFEDGFGRNNQPIDDIVGITFEVTGGYDWIYGDSSTGSWNTRSIDLGYGVGSYQHYGNVFAFLGTDNNAGSGKIDFTNNDGTWFQTRYTSFSSFYLEGYDIYGAMIASASGGANTDGQHMGQLRIDAPVGQYLSYIMVHDSGNYFLIDNISGDTTGIPGGNGAIPEPMTMALFGIGLLGTGYLRRRK